MFLSAVILVLQEILEAAVLISVLMVLTQLFARLWPGSFRGSKRWVKLALLCGFIGAALYAWWAPEISELFDYVGYEIVNATLQFMSVALLLLLCNAINPARVETHMRRRLQLVVVCMVAMVVLGVIREGSEIILYVNGIVGQPENTSPVLLGTLMAAGIGGSCSVMLFTGLLLLPDVWAFRGAILLLAFFGGNMSAQAVQLLVQADWISFSSQAWDSSWLLSEDSILGHLLYALIGYEANPDWSQVAAWLLVLVLVLVSSLSRMAWTGIGKTAGQLSVKEMQ